MTLLIVILYITVGVGLTAIVFPDLDYLETTVQKTAMFVFTTLLLPPFFVWHTLNYYWKKI